MTLPLTSSDGRVVLRPLTMEDLERNHRWHNDASLYTMLVGSHREVSLETEEAWLARRMAADETELNLALCVAETGEHVGNIYLREINRATRQAEIHLFIGEAQHRGFGYGSAAIACLVGHAFEALGLERVVLQVLANNEAAIRSYARCGFVHEGPLPAPVNKGGQPVTVLAMALDRGGS